MSDQKAAVTVPAVGKGSLKGPRWFVSRNPGLTLEVIAEQDGNRAKFIRVGFKSEDKSPLHVGDGRLGSRNTLGTDTNSNRRYGVYFIMDPGPAPKDGYKGDEDLVKDNRGIEQESWTRTAEEKADDRRIIDHFRKTHLYRNTPQNNAYVVTGRLIELDWDPAEIRIHVASMVIPGMNKPMPRPPLAGAPVDAAPEREAAASGPSMGTKLNRRSAA